MSEKAYDVFISYANPDEDFATAVAKRLSRFKFKGRRLRIAFAPEGIRPGESIPGRLIELLDCSRLTLAVVTPSWAGSRWCQFETETRLWEDPAARERSLLPLLLKSSRLPASLGRLKYIDFRAPGSFEPKLHEMVRAIREKLEYDAAIRESQEIASDILRESLLPWVPPAGPNLKFIWPELVVDPLVRSYRNPSRPVSFNAFRAEDSGAGSYVVVTGDPGSGKSMSLRGLVLQALHNRESASFRHASQHLEADELQAGRGHIWVVDGLDEVSVERARDVFLMAEDKARKGLEVWLGVRSEFLFRHAQSLKGSWNRIDEVVEILPWKDATARKFVESYARKALRPDVIPQAHRLMGGRLAGVLLQNPMRLTLLLFILIHSDSGIDFSSEFGLYSRFYREWLKAEVRRGTSRLAEVEIVKAHTRAARWLNGHKRDLYVPEEGGLLTDSGYTGLMDFGRGDGVAFRHETIGEWLIAAAIVKGFVLGGQALDESLEYVVGDNVNRFVRSGFSEFGVAQRQTVVTNLIERYEQLTGSRAEDVGRTALLREQVLYYLGRIGDHAALAILARAASLDLSSEPRGSWSAPALVGQV